MCVRARSLYFHFRAYVSRTREVDDVDGRRLRRTLHGKLVARERPDQKREIRKLQPAARRSFVSFRDAKFIARQPGDGDVDEHSLIPFRRRCKFRSAQTSERPSSEPNYQDLLRPASPLLPLFYPYIHSRRSFRIRAYYASGRHTDINWRVSACPPSPPTMQSTAN